MLQGEAMSFLKELWTLLDAYKFRGYSMDGREMFAIPLSWLMLILIVLLFAS